MTRGAERELAGQGSAVVGSLALGLPVFGAACVGCLGVAVGAAVLAPISGLGGAWKLVAVVLISTSVSVFRSRKVPRSGFGRLFSMGRAVISAVFVYTALIGVGAIVVALASAGSAPGLVLP